MTLRVIVQIVPFGDEEKAYEIDRLDIGNFGLIDYPDTCQYMYKFKKDTEFSKYGVEHSRKDGAWALIRKVLGDCLLEKNR